VCQILITALLLSEESGCEVIGLNHLAAAVKQCESHTEAEAHSAPPYLPVPFCRKYFSSAAEAFITGLGGFEHLTVAGLRNVLLPEGKRPRPADSSL
jgi:hypothetical protein